MDRPEDRAPRGRSLTRGPAGVATPARQQHRAGDTLLPNGQRGAWQRLPYSSRPEDRAPTGAWHHAGRDTRCLCVYCRGLAGWGGGALGGWEG